MPFQTLPLLEGACGWFTITLEVRVLAGSLDQAKRALSPTAVYQTNADNLGDIVLVTATRGVHQAPVYPMFDFGSLFDGEMPLRKVE